MFLVNSRYRHFSATPFSSASPILQAGCFMAYYCLNINDDHVFSFLSKDIGDENGLRRRAVRYFFRLGRNWCRIHQWIVNGHYSKFEHAMSFFTNEEKKNMFHKNMDICYFCSNPKGKNSMFFSESLVLPLIISSFS